MKIFKIIALAAIIIMASVSISSAVTYAWDQHTDDRVIGYVIRWTESDISSEIFSKTLTGIDSVLYEIPEINLKPNVAYDVWVTAFSNIEESLPSTIVPYTRVIDTFTPPDDNLPTEEYPVDSSPINVPTGLNRI